MKNMTLPAKNSNRLLIAVLTVLTVFFSGCNNEPETLYSDKARPAWTVTEAGDMTLSMTAVVKPDLTVQYPKIATDFVVEANDLMAAFIGETCLGVAQPQDGLFFLYIAAPVTGNPSSVTLRYYSAHYKNLFVVIGAFPFVNDDHLGTVSNPIVPAFVKSK